MEKKQNKSLAADIPAARLAYNMGNDNLHAANGTVTYFWYADPAAFFPDPAGFHHPHCCHPTMR